MTDWFKYLIKCLWVGHDLPHLIEGSKTVYKCRYCGGHVEREA